MQTWFSFQVVEIYGGFGTELLLFQSRGQRLRFTSALEAICPNAHVYRKKPPPKEYELRSSWRRSSPKRIPEAIELTEGLDWAA